MIQQLAIGDLTAGGGRLLLYQDTLEQIVQNPLFGSGLEEKYSRFYPHNHILEAFMTTGVLGGLCFVILCWVTIKRSFLILQKEESYGWIACLFIIYFVHGLFSSSIIDSSFWYSMMAVYAVPIAGPATYCRGKWYSNSVEIRKAPVSLLRRELSNKDVAQCIRIQRIPC